LSGRGFAWIASLCLAGGALLLLFASGSRPRDHTAPTNPPDTARGGSRAAPITSAPDDRAARPARSARALRRRLAPELELPGHVLRHRIRASLAAARGFLAGYLAFEAGAGRAALARLRAHAHHQLARVVAARRPRLLATRDGPPPAGRIAQLAGEFDKPPRSVRCRALIDRGGRFSELGLTVTQKGARWIVTDMTE
jgi:hypothetical protein